MHTTSLRKILPFIACMPLTALLESCVTQPSPPPLSVLPPPIHGEARKEEPAKPAKPHYGMDSYIKQLTMAQLKLAKEPDNIPSVITGLETIQVFAAEKHKPAVSQPVIIISYHIKGSSGTRQLAAPFIISQGNDFPELQDIMSELQDVKYVMEDIHPATLTRLPAKNIVFPINEPQKVKAMVDAELSLLLLTRTSFTPIEEAKIQLSLLQFFLKQRIRDAAYLTDENAAQSLADAENSGADAATIKMLSRELDTLESRLHKEMPFTFSTIKTPQ